MEVIVDRIEENFLVLELPNGEFINVPKKLIPNALEGDVIEIKINKEKRMQKTEKIQTLAAKLFEEEA